MSGQKQSNIILPDNPGQVTDRIVLLTSLRDMAKIIIGLLNRVQTSKDVQPKDFKANDQQTMLGILSLYQEALKNSLTTNFTALDQDDKGKRMIKIMSDKLLHVDQLISKWNRRLHEKDELVGCNKESIQVTDVPD